MMFAKIDQIHASKQLSTFVSFVRTRPEALPTLLYALMVTVYSFRVPPLEGLDEKAHYAYIEYLVQSKQLPVLAVHPGPFEYEMHQPPLYYVLAAGIQEIQKMAGFSTVTQIYVLRWISAIIGILTILLVVRAVRFVGLPRPWLAGILIASIPQFVYVTSLINNDSLAFFLGSLLFLCILGLAEEKPVRWMQAIGFGFVGGLATLVKLSTLPVFLTLVLFMVGRAMRSQHRCTMLSGLARTGMTLLIYGLVAGWWFTRNVSLYGDPFGYSRFSTAMAVPGGYTLGPETLRPWFWLLFHSFWAVFGQMNTFVAPWMYRVWQVWSLLYIGLFFYGILFTRRQWSFLQTYGIGSAIAILAILLVGMLRYSFIDYQPQGRFLFIGIVPIGILFATALHKPVHARLVRVLQWGLVVISLAMALVVPFGPWLINGH